MPVVVSDPIHNQGPVITKAPTPSEGLWARWHHVIIPAFSSSVVSIGFALGSIGRLTAAFLAGLILLNVFQLRANRRRSVR